MQLDLVAFLTSFSCVFNNYFSCLHNYVAYLACLRRHATTVINSILTYLGLLLLLGHRPPTSCLHTTRSCAVFSPVLSRTFNICLQIPSPAITWFTSFPFYLGVPCNSKVSLNSKSLN